MSRKHRERDNSVPKPKKEIKLEESYLMKAVKNPAFIKFLEKYPQYSDFMDRLPTDRALQQEVARIFTAWEKAPDAISELKKFYGKTLGQETGIKLNDEDLKAIELHINQLTIDPDNCELVGQLLDKINKFQEFPEEISKKQIELVSLADSVSAETAKEQQRLKIAEELGVKEIGNLYKQLEIRKQRLERRIDNQGWLNKKNIPLLGRFFRDREDNLARAKSVKEWESDIEIIETRILQLESADIGAFQANQAEPVLQAEEKIRTGQEAVQDFRRQYQDLKQFFLRDFELVQDIVDLARTKMQKDYDSILKDKDNFALDNAQKDFDRLAGKEDGEISDELFLGLKQEYLKTLDEAISSRFYADCQRVMRTFAWGKDSDKGKLKGLLHKFLEKEKLGSQPQEAVSGIAAAALVDTLLASKDDRKKFTLKMLAVDLGINLQESLAAAIDQARDENERKQLLDLASKFFKGGQERVTGGSSAEEIADRIKLIKENAENFLAGLNSVHSFEELTAYVKSQSIKSLQFDKVIYFEKYLLDIIEEAKRTKKVDKFNNAPHTLQAKIKELIDASSAPKAENKPEKKPKPEAKPAEAVKPEAPAPKAPEKSMEEPAEVKPETKPEPAPEKVKPIVVEQKILAEDDLGLLLENKIKAIRDAVNEMGAKLAIAEAGKLVERYLDRLKANRIINKGEYKKLRKEISAELGQLRGNQLQAAAKIEEINQQLKKIETGDLSEKKPEALKTEPEPESQAEKINEIDEEMFFDKIIKCKNLMDLLNLIDENHGLKVNYVRSNIRDSLEINAKMRDWIVTAINDPRKVLDAPYDVTKDITYIGGFTTKLMELARIHDAEMSQPTDEKSPEDQAQEIVDGIYDSKQIVDLIKYIKTLPRLVDAEGREMTGQEAASKIAKAMMNAGEIAGMSEEELPTTYGLRDKVQELLGLKQ
ncbi:MAG: hypothetical protein NTX82_00265 [Candidatus Parcubacteria bacterium]|nr:hypothetical protein [Candidatus Parcubacteria bacterium]